MDHFSSDEQPFVLCPPYLRAIQASIHGYSRKKTNLINKQINRACFAHSFACLPVTSANLRHYFTAKEYSIKASASWLRTTFSRKGNCLEVRKRYDSRRVRFSIFTFQNVFSLTFLLLQYCVPRMPTILNYLDYPYHMVC